MSETSLLPREKRVDGGFNTGIDKTLENLERDAQQRDGSIALWTPGDSFGLRIATTSTLIQILGTLRLHNQEDRNSNNHDFISKPAWSINSGKMESGPAAFPGFWCWRTDMSSSMVKSSERF